jgi:hypothetical protein
MIFYVTVFVVVFSLALSGVIGRYFGAITLCSSVNQLFLFGFSSWRYRRYTLHDSAW